MAGDLNKLSDDKVIEATGLLSLVKQPTRGAALLDRLYASEDCFSLLWVLTSVVKSNRNHSRLLWARCHQGKNKDLSFDEKKVPAATRSLP